MLYFSDSLGKFKLGLSTWGYFLLFFFETMDEGLLKGGNGVEEKEMKRKERESSERRGGWKGRMRGEEGVANR